MTAAVTALVWIVVVGLAAGALCSLTALVFVARLIRRAGITEVARRLGRRR